MPQRCLLANELQDLSKPQPRVDQSIAQIMATLKANSDRLKLMLNKRLRKQRRPEKCQKMNQSGTHHKPPTNKIQGLIMHINETEKTGRIIFLDQVKAMMIALVIATHTILAGTLFTTDLKQIIEAAPAYEAISF